jgi:hypothetical protein
VIEQLVSFTWTGQRGIQFVFLPLPVGARLGVMDAPIS